MVNMTHRDIIDYDVLHSALIHLLKSKTAAPHTGAVGNGDVTIATIRLRTKFNASTYPVHFLRDILTTEESAELIACHDTISNEDMFTEHRLLQRIRTFQYDGIVVRSVNFRVADCKILAAVDVNAVAIGVDGYIINCSDITPSGDNGKVPSSIDGDVADGDVTTEFQGNRLVTSANRSSLHVAGIFRIVLRQSFTIYQSSPCDADVLLALCPYQRVVKISVPSILIFWKSAKRLTLVVDLHLSWSSQNLGTSHQVQVHIAFQTNASTEISTRG